MIMLKAVDFPDETMPKFLVHGWWNLGGAKMSKSAGNIVDPFALAEKYGPEALRYYLMRDIATGNDADFAEERLVTRYDTELANSLGNLLNRTLTMVAKYRDEKLRPAQGDGSVGETLQVITKSKTEESIAAMDAAQIASALDKALEIVIRSNVAIETAAPWKMVKDPAKGDHLDLLLYSLGESIRIVAILISPVLPKAAHGIFDQLNWKMELSGKEERFRLEDVKWGGLPDGHVVGKPVPLFPRIEG
jgi:methionyl-tRNA synthetase